MSYEEKYLKYKNKYLSLKNSTFNQIGGNFFKMPAFNKPSSPVVEVNQNTIQNEIINYNKLTERIKTINAKINDKGVTERLTFIENKWKPILDSLVDQIKTNEEAKKRYNGLLKELETKQKIVNNNKMTLDAFPAQIAKVFAGAKEFLSLVEIEAKNAESLLVQFDAKQSQNIAKNEFNNLVHQRRESMSEEKKNKSKSSSTSSLKSLGATPK